jgi:hypothetical protein
MSGPPERHELQPVAAVIVMLNVPGGGTEFGGPQLTSML